MCYIQTMNLKELIQKIDIDAVILDDRIKDGIDDLFRTFNIHYDVVYSKVDEQTRLYGSYISASYCTDTWIGLKVYVFDREVVAFSFQKGRKYDKEFIWVSRELYNVTKEFCRSFLENPEDEITLISDDVIINDDGYKLHFASDLIPQRFHQTAMLNAESVVIVGQTNPKDYISHNVNIRHQDGTETVERIDDLIFPYRLLKTNKL